jgi:FkbM family methyltransferase
MANRLRKATDRVVALRIMAESRPAQYLIRTARAARAVREPRRFIALQLAPPRAAGYRLRDSGLKIYLRHRTRDVDIFKEIFGAGYGPNSYEPPAAVAAALDAKGAPAVLDLGGNIGLFAVYVLGRWPRATVRSFEPDATNLPILNRVIVANQLEGSWSVADVAVANRAGEQLFVAGLFAESQLAEVVDPAARAPDSAPLEGGETITVRTVDLFEQDHDVDLMKIDIEGGEWSILTDPRLGSLRADAIVLEWHASGCPEPDPRATAIALLRAAGYRRLEESENFGHRGLLWAWREPGSPT